MSNLARKSNLLKCANGHLRRNCCSSCEPCESYQLDSPPQQRYIHVNVEWTGTACCQVESAYYNPDYPGTSVKYEPVSQNTYLNYGFGHVMFNAYSYDDDTCTNLTTYQMANLPVGVTSRLRADSSLWWDQTLEKWGFAISYGTKIFFKGYTDDATVTDTTVFVNLLTTGNGVACGDMVSVDSGGLANNEVVYLNASNAAVTVVCTLSDNTNKTPMIWCECDSYNLGVDIDVDVIVADGSGSCSNTVCNVGGNQPICTDVLMASFVCEKDEGICVWRMNTGDPWIVYGGNDWHYFVNVTYYPTLNAITVQGWIKCSVNVNYDVDFNAYSLIYYLDEIPARFKDLLPLTFDAQLELDSGVATIILSEA